MVLPVKWNISGCNIFKQKLFRKLYVYPTLRKKVSLSYGYIIRKSFTFRFRVLFRKLRFLIKNTVVFFRCIVLLRVVSEPVKLKISVFHCINYWNIMFTADYISVLRNFTWIFVQSIEINWCYFLVNQKRITCKILSIGICGYEIILTNFCMEQFLI